MKKNKREVVERERDHSILSIFWTLEKVFFRFIIHGCRYIMKMFVARKNVWSKQEKETKVVTTSEPSLFFLILLMMINPIQIN